MKTTTVCNKCGEPTETIGEDSLDYCENCGIVEGDTHEVPNEECETCGAKLDTPHSQDTCLDCQYDLMNDARIEEGV